MGPGVLGVRGSGGLGVRGPVGLGAWGPGGPGVRGPGGHALNSHTKPRTEHLRLTHIACVVFWAACCPPFVSSSHRHSTVQASYFHPSAEELEALLCSGRRAFPLWGERALRWTPPGLVLKNMPQTCARGAAAALCQGTCRRPCARGPAVGLVPGIPERVLVGGESGWVVLQAAASPTHLSSAAATLP